MNFERGLDGYGSGWEKGDGEGGGMIQSKDNGQEEEWRARWKVDYKGASKGGQDGQWMIMDSREVVKKGINNGLLDNRRTSGLFNWVQ